MCMCGVHTEVSLFVRGKRAERKHGADCGRKEMQRAMAHKKSVLFEPVPACTREHPAERSRKRWDPLALISSL